jgi:hypothetical protein
MPPQALALALFLIEEGIKEEPALAADLRDLFNKTDPTAADWDALHAKVAAKTYRDYVPATALVVTQLAAPAAAPEAPAAAPAPAPTAEAPAAAPAPATAAAVAEAPVEKPGIGLA